MIEPDDITNLCKRVDPDLQPAENINTGLESELLLMFGHLTENVLRASSIVGTFFKSSSCLILKSIFKISGCYNLCGCWLFNFSGNLRKLQL
ncbi:MAG: hypothetical protein EAZ78_15550 [Oscillatoriales cyanobacterium]|nr:MAG: hypothetical protein EAZ78_15550 [Oscillatoriales cyanobacterium]